MGITYGDYLIDSGYYDITPEQERESEARYEAGMYQSLYENAQARIEALEAALRKISGWPSSCEEARNIARAALAPEQDK